MEEMLDINKNNERIENKNIVNVKESEVIKIFSSPENPHAFAFENSKHN